MRTSLTALALTAALTGGGTALATQAAAAPVQSASLESTPVVVAQEQVDADDGDNTGLWGLLGLLGLAGLLKRKEHADTSSTRH